MLLTVPTKHISLRWLKCSLQQAGVITCKLRWKITLKRLFRVEFCVLMMRNINRSV